MKFWIINETYRSGGDRSSERREPTVPSKPAVEVVTSRIAAAATDVDYPNLQLLIEELELLV